MNDFASDVNECLDLNGGCEQTCVNLKGSFQCECSRGYQVAEDKKSCQGNYTNQTNVSLTLLWLGDSMNVRWLGWGKINHSPEKLL